MHDQLQMRYAWILLIVTATLLATTAPATAVVVTFADEKMENRVRYTLSIPAPTPITDTDMETMEKLRAGYSNISNVQGLQYATNLTDLGLGGNQISDISPVAGLTNLTKLKLDGNDVSDISAISNLTNLTELYMPYNQFSDISPVAGLTNLTWMNLSKNQISDISSIAGLVNLDYLDMGYNPISDISAVAGLTNLTGLTMWHNQISDISAVAGLANLIDLNLPYNQISDISAVAGLTNLSRLWMSNNQISDISAVAGLTNLDWLSLSSNQISNISAVSGLTNLTGLSLGYNQISDISAVAGLTNLAILSLNNNQISDISPVAGLTNLPSLYLHDNQISDISVLAGMTNLDFLYLDNNQISDISALAGLTNLSYLGLSFNQISDYSHLAGLTNLRSLSLDYNQISDFSALVDLTNLTHLALSYNQIETIDLGGTSVSSLERFSIGGNPLTDVLLADATLNQTAFDALLDGGESWFIGVAELPGVLRLDMSGVDFTVISNLSKMYSMDDLEELLLSGATNLDGSQIVALSSELDSLDWLDVTGPWDSFDVGTQSLLNAWDAIEGNTLVISEPLTDVSIDIKPGSDPNSINLDSNGNILVAIFSTDSFDATTVDPATILLADAGVKARGKKGDLMSSFKDVDGDGLLDLLIHIDTEGLVLGDDDVEAQLTGETFDGLSFLGTDAIRIVGKSGGPSPDAFASEDAYLLGATTVPEPATIFMLLVLGGLALMWRWRR